MAPRETENSAYAKFWSEQQIVLWYVIGTGFPAKCHVRETSVEIMILVTRALLRSAL